MATKAVYISGENAFAGKLGPLMPLAIEFTRIYISGDARINYLCFVVSGDHRPCLNVGIASHLS